MSEICKCCRGEVSVNFCSYCGQRKATRIDGKYIKDELQYVLVHTNKGFFYSVKKIIRNPGKTAAEFIDGNRVHHYKPILMVFLLAGLSAFITNTFIHPLEIHQQFNQMHGFKSAIQVDSMTSWMLKYQSLVMLAMIPFFAIFSWLAFKKWGYNYYENVVASAYLLSAMLIFGLLVTTPLQFFLRGNPDLFVIIPTLLAYASMFGISLWFYIGLYSDKSAGPVILRVLLMFLLMFVITSVISIGIGIVYAMSHPELFAPPK